MNQSTFNQQTMKNNFQSFAETLTENSHRIGWAIIAISLLSLAFMLTSCQGDDKKSDPQDLLRQTWILGTDGTVTKDGSDVTDEYTGLTVTFANDGTYTALNSGHFFQASGTWAWQDEAKTSLALDGDFLVSVVELTKTDLHLQLELSVDDLEGGRVTGLVGDYDIKLKAQ